MRFALQRQVPNCGHGFCRTTTMTLTLDGRVWLEAWVHCCVPHLVPWSARTRRARIGRFNQWAKLLVGAAFSPPIRPSSLDDAPGHLISPPLSMPRCAPHPTATLTSSPSRAPPRRHHRCPSPVRLDRTGSGVHGELDPVEEVTSVWKGGRFEYHDSAQVRA